ncbi:MAG TPA: asparagine--tRNA ligase [Caldisericia bacterium]|jgi:asparaginyl-tRNA synthetase|nr:asparagine--tRNA ligase [Caldisericia bacterium]HXK51959.1 asparagine--tRNA ligase [Caldisericia bacterium]
MKSFTISLSHEYIQQEVTIQGWIYNIRSSGKILFVILRDGSGFIQCIVMKNTIGEELFEKIKHLSQESSVVFTGIIKEDHRSPWGYEMEVSSADIIQSVQDEYPIQLKDHGVGFLSNYRHLWVRTPTQRSILKIRAEVIQGIRDFLNQNGFVNFDSPIITGSAPEGTTSLFALDYFGENAYLSQSGQLYQEAGAMAFRRVYCFGPTFRAEKSKTRRHLTEFWMVEPEMAFCDVYESMQIQEGLTLYIIQRVLDQCTKELNILQRDTEKLKSIQGPFPRVKYESILELLNQHQRDKKWGDDITGLDETIISQEYEQPVFITNFPKDSKPFYMKESETDPGTVLGADLMAPEGYGEIIGGSQREDDLDNLLMKIKKTGLNPETYQWYIDLRKFGSVPHSGFGMGVERMTAWMCGIDHIRETIPFPRTIERIYP